MANYEEMFEIVNKCKYNLESTFIVYVLSIGNFKIIKKYLYLIVLMLVEGEGCCDVNDIHNALLSMPEDFRTMMGVHADRFAYIAIVGGHYKLFKYLRNYIQDMEMVAQYAANGLFDTTLFDIKIFHEIKRYISDWKIINAFLLFKGMPHLLQAPIDNPTKYMADFTQIIDTGIGYVNIMFYLPTITLHYLTNVKNYKLFHNGGEYDIMYFVKYIDSTVPKRLTYGFCRWYTSLNVVSELDNHSSIRKYRGEMLDSLNDEDLRNLNEFAYIDRNGQLFVKTYGLMIQRNLLPHHKYTSESRINLAIMAITRYPKSNYDQYFDKNAILKYAYERRILDIVKLLMQ